MSVNNLDGSEQVSCNHQLFPTSISYSFQPYTGESSVESDLITHPNVDKEETIVPLAEIDCIAVDIDEPVDVNKPDSNVVRTVCPFMQSSNSFSSLQLKNINSEDTKLGDQNAGKSVNNQMRQTMGKTSLRRNSSMFTTVNPKMLHQKKFDLKKLKIDLGTCRPIQELKLIGIDFGKKKALEKTEREHIRKLERQRLILSLRSRAMSPANSIKSYSSTSTINSTTSSGYESLEELLDIDTIKLGRDEIGNIQVPDVLKTKVIKNQNIFQREYIVEDVLQIEEEKTIPLFFIKWKGYKQMHNTWEPFENINDCEALPRFLQRQCNEKRDVLYMILNDINMEIEEQGFQLSDDLKMVTVIDDFNPMKYLSDLLLLAFFKLAKSRSRVTTTKIRQRVKIALLQRPLYLRRQQQMLSILEWKESINVIETSANINVENNVDYDIPHFWSPENCNNLLNMSNASDSIDVNGSTNGYFTYIKECLISPAIKVIPNTSLGCACEEGCQINSKCCSSFFQYPFAYSKIRKLRLGPGTPIYECNDFCKCGPDCNNRIVQNGRKNSLCIFKTHNNCGWGVKTEKTIMRGEYVCEYVGEVITSEEADRRGKVYDSQGRTYLFDLDYTESGQAAYTIDAAHYGNVARFINHSCSPNVQVWPMWSNNLDPLLHRLAFFALDKIEAGNELTFNYIQNDIEYSNVSDSERKPCHCGANNCKKWLFF